MNGSYVCVYIYLLTVTSARSSVPRAPWGGKHSRDVSDHGARFGLKIRGVPLADCHPLFTATCMAMKLSFLATFLAAKSAKQDPVFMATLSCAITTIFPVFLNIF